MTSRPPGGGRSGALGCALAAALSLIPAAPPATAAPLSRSAAVARALARSPETTAFDAVVADSARLVAVAGAYPIAPRLGLEADFDRLGPFDADLSSVRLELSQELDPGNRRGARRAVAMAEAAVTHAAAHGHAHALARRTEEAFGALLVAERRAALAESSAATASRLALAGERAARSEAISGYDLRRLALASAVAGERAAAARGAREAATSALRVLLLAPPGEAIDPLDDVAAVRWRCAADSLAQVALERRHDVVEARAAESLLDAESRLAGREGRPGPEVALFVARDYERVGAAAFGGALDFVPGFNGFEQAQTTFGASITVPFAFRSPNEWQEGRLDALGLRASATRQRLEASVPIEVAAACAQVEAAQERSALLAGALTHADADRERIAAAYREGRLELEAALAQRERLDAAAAAATDALADLEAARSALAHATGLSHAELAAALGDAPQGDAR